MKPYYEQDGVTIYCGDCRDILPTIEPATVALVLTDPPYGIALKEHGRNGYDWSVIGDHDQELGQIILDDCRSRNIPIVTFASPKKPWDGVWRQHLVWDKGPAVGGGGDPKTCWKTTWELIQIWNTGKLNGPRESAVLKYWVGQRDYRHHPCQKPVGLLAYLIGKTTNQDALIVDPFMGSGSVLVAAQTLGRRVIGMEVSEEYCEIAVRRLQQQALQLEVAS